MGVIELFSKYNYYYISGIKTTISLSFLALLIGSVLGFVLSLMRLSRSRILKFISAVYIELIRGTPIIVQISMVYFGSYVLFGIDINKFLSALIAVALNSAAYVAEIIRSGIQSVDKGQTEASRSLGVSRSKTMQHIILPQAIKNILPALGNEFVTLIKETSVASVIGTADLMYASKIVSSKSYQAFTPLVVIAIIYFVLTFSLSQLVAYFERRMAHND